MKDLLLMFYLGGVTAGVAPAFGSRDRVGLQLLLTLGWPVLAVGGLMRLVLFQVSSERV